MKQNSIGPFAPGDLLTPLKVVDLTIEGMGLARHEGRVVFLDGPQGLPGAVVATRVRKVTKDVLFAEITDLIQASPHAVDPRCPHAFTCGGCAWRRLASAAALAWKHNHVAQCLRRIGKVAEPLVMDTVPCAEGKAFRNKMVFAFAPDGNGGCLLGLRRPKEHTVIEVTDCRLSARTSMDLVTFVRELVAAFGLQARADNGQGYLRHLVLHSPEFQPEGRPQLLVECITGPKHGQGKGAGNAAKVRRLGEALMERFHLTGFVHSERRHNANVAQGEKTIARLGNAEYQERVGHLTLTVPHNAFFQTNTAMAERLCEAIAAEAALTGREVLWDLYCGVGTIGLFLAEKAAKVHGFESNPAAVAAARKNAGHLGDHCRYHHVLLPDGIRREIPMPDVIVVDPPKSGMDAALVDALNALPARKILYVSCDPATQARDLARMSSSWRLIRSLPFDMFPYTPHVENLIVLEPSALSRPASS